LNTAPTIAIASLKTIILLDNSVQLPAIDEIPVLIFEN